MMITSHLTRGGGDESALGRERRGQTGRATGIVTDIGRALSRAETASHRDTIA